MNNVVKTSQMVYVVRCKDCINRNTLDCPLCYEDEGYIFNMMTDKAIGSDDWYCKNGARKDDAERDV